MRTSAAVPSWCGARVCLCLALLLAGTVGCIATVKPEPCQLPALPSPPLLRIINISESYAAPIAGTVGNTGFSGGSVTHLALAVGQAMRQPGLNLVSDDPSNLGIRVDLHTRVVPHPEDDTLIMVSGLSVGIIPLFYTYEFEVTCDSTICMPDGTVIKSYQCKQPATLNEVFFPPVLMTMWGGLVTEKEWMTQVKSAAVQNLVAKLSNMIAADYPTIKLAKERFQRAAEAYSPAHAGERVQECGC